MTLILANCLIACLQENVVSTKADEEAKIVSVVLVYDKVIHSDDLEVDPFKQNRVDIHL